MLTRITLVAGYGGELTGPSRVKSLSRT